MLGRLPSNAGSPVSGHPLAGLSDPELTARWLVARQTLTLDEEDAIEKADGEEIGAAKTPADAPPVVKLHGLPSQTTVAGGLEGFDFLQWAGFNGRCNKIADTCYAWWVCASLSVRIQKWPVWSVSPTQRLMF